MHMRLARVTLFTKNMPDMTAFYRDVLGLPQVTEEKGFREFDAGGCRIALHNGSSRIGARPPKLVFGGGPRRADRARRQAWRGAGRPRPGTL